MLVSNVVFYTHITRIRGIVHLGPQFFERDGMIVHALARFDFQPLFPGTSLGS